MGTYVGKCGSCGNCNPVDEVGGLRSGHCTRLGRKAEGIYSLVVNFSRTQCKHYKYDPRRHCECGHVFMMACGDLVCTGCFGFGR